MGIRSLLTTVACLAFTRSVVITEVTNCDSRETFYKEQRQCFAAFSDVLKDKTLDEIQHLSQTEPRFTCNHLDRYRHALACALNKARECTLLSYKDILMDEPNMNQMLDRLCRTIDEIDIPCARRVVLALEECGISKSIEYSNYTGHQGDHKALICFIVRVNTECQYRVLSRCGCRTTRLYIDISKRHVNPKGCGPIISVPTPVCDDKTGAFLNGSPRKGTQQQLLAAVLILMSTWLR